SARSWWPSKDLPEDRAFVDLTLTVPDGNMAVSNGSLVSTESVAGSKTRYRWEHGYTISTYLIAFCVSDYLYDSALYTGLDGTTTMEVGHYVFQTSADELDAVPDTIATMEFFAETFGEYPFIDEKYVTMTW